MVHSHTVHLPRGALLSPCTACVAQVETWLALANVTLDDANPELQPDYRDATKFPKFRTAGVEVCVGVWGGCTHYAQTMTRTSPYISPYLTGGDPHRVLEQAPRDRPARV